MSLGVFCRLYTQAFAQVRLSEYSKTEGWLEDERIREVNAED